MNTNFTFIKTEFPTIYSEAVEAERLALVSPKAAAVLCRSALETAVRWLYVHDPDLNEPYDTKLSSLMYEYSFKDLLKPAMFHEINNIRKIGNSAAHGNRVTQRESLTSLKYLFRFISYIAIYYAQDEPDIPEFNEAIIPTGNESEKTQAEIDKLETRLEEQKKTWLAERELLVKQIRESEELRTQVKEQQSKVKKRRESRAKVVVEESVIPLLVSEKETRRIYIDQLLKESGWINLKEGRDLEYELAGMPKVTNKSGIGYADYVLWADNGLPLAVIEAKSTMYDARKGRHQAELYADCLEQMHGQRPIIFYTNGFDSHIWDDTFYTDRKIDGFYSKDELQRLIDRRTDREDLRTFKINTEIAGRPYQMEAIQRIAENFCMADNNGNLTGRERQGLLVMATGSGKTRTSAAIVDMLTKCNWAKRVLFLADRNVLVTQAKNAFNEYLPHLSAIDLTKESEDNGTRLVFSTYPTIMNRIDSVKNRHERFYGVGHFDLIIIDEAHRTVYQKYRAIFEYFDSLLIGLTATPKKDIDRNTYGLFGIEDDNPTFSYELNTAVNDGYLVPFKVISVPLKFPREGIKYNDLSEEEKLEYEEKFYDPLTGEFPEEITGSALNSWLFNTDTVDKVLEFVMEKGIKVEGGDKLGKTIIFAKNHEHAVFIEKRFNKKYPEHNSKFMRVIDNYETKAHDLLKTFADVHEELDPQIAVSVDMMDTGVDAPRVVNLLFFKLVRSSSKFWQMIGRGTRLCPDLFAPDEDKTHFLLFDFCENFEFFDLHPDGVAGIGSASLSQKIFEAKLEFEMLIS
jgi:type I restriction enzyme R subunit